MSTSRLNFKLEATATGSRARAATFRTLHNEVKTPLFMPVGTQATVKAQTFDTLLESGSQILLANTYHLLLRPGPEVFKSFGGIHKFTGWEKSFLTDSGGFQIFSLPHARNMKEEGAEFRSYVDGAIHLLSPETSIGTQVAIGSDIMMVLDQCIPSTADRSTAKEALEITHRWAIRSLKARGDSPQSMFAIVQGALYPDLRKISADGLTQLPFDGFAIGGLAVGEGKSQREDTCEIAAAMLPADKPRYLMGVGTPLDLLEAVHRGVDMFDCIIPNKVAQFGTAYTSRGILQLRRSIYKFSEEKIDALCKCPVCAKYSRGYLHHLTKTQEPLGWTLLGQHNIFFYHQMMREIRQSILEDSFLAYYHDRRQVLQVEDMDNPAVPPKVGKERRPRTLGDYEIHIHEIEGFANIRQISSGEIMHLRRAPMDEAKALYIDQAKLSERLKLPEGQTPETAAPIVIWDLGLGAAANAMASILCYEAEAAKGPVRNMKVISFENDMDSLKLAMSHKNRFEYLRHSGPDAVLARGTWQSRQILASAGTCTSATSGRSPPRLPPRPISSITTSSPRRPILTPGSSSHLISFSRTAIPRSPRSSSPIARRRPCASRCSTPASMSRTEKAPARRKRPSSRSALVSRPPALTRSSARNGWSAGVALRRNSQMVSRLSSRRRSRRGLRGMRSF
ncbi:MAG: hypothetical protein RJB43_950 [Verrucomicrobiota bacterium]